MVFLDQLLLRERTFLISCMNVHQTEHFYTLPEHLHLVNHKLPNSMLARSINVAKFAKGQPLVVFQEGQHN